VAAFRARDYPRAEAAFEEAARTETMAPLAHYNLALVALERGNEEAARKWLARVQEESTDERLRNLAERRLASLPPPPQRTWFAYGALGAGYDDNVALVSSSDVLGVSGIDDAFAEAQLALGVPLDDWAFDAGMFYVDYQDLDEFDQLGAHGAGRYRLELGDWTNELVARLSYTTLDGEGFENRRELGVRASRDMATNWRLRIQYRYSDIEGLNRFTGISGHDHEASVRALREDDRWDLSLEYRYELGEHRDEDLSATRHQLGLTATRHLTSSWSLSIDAMLRKSQYDVDANGDENLAELAVAVGRGFGSRWRLVLRYAYTDNDADRPEFTYERNRIAAVVEAVL
jgi:Tetratricopeptide repeat